MFWLLFGIIMVGLLFTFGQANAGGFQCLGYCAGAEPYVEGFWDGRMTLDSVDRELGESHDAFAVFLLVGDTQEQKYDCPPDYPADCVPYVSHWADFQIFLDRKMIKRFGAGRIDLDWVGNRALWISVWSDDGNGFYCRSFYTGRAMKGFCEGDLWQATPENQGGEPTKFFAGSISLKR